LIIYLNGRFTRRDEAGIDPLERGVLLGEGVFETMRAESGQLLHADRHHARMSQGAQRLGLAWTMTAPIFRDVCQQVIDANALSEARVRATLLAPAQDGTPGSGETGAPPTLMIFALPLAAPEVLARLATPWKLHVASFPANHRSPLAGIKSTSYLPHLLARREAVANSADEALLLNTDGAVAECAMANIFVVRTDGTILTPRVEDGALPGIMRGEILRIAAELGIPSLEAAISRDDLPRAAEVFATNVIQQIVPVSSIEGTWNGGAPGPVTSRLFAAYRASVATHLEAIRLG
jgi:branched-subunit amino acid aminotransferase/4-amino-4-deoxychorismate lyase